MTKAEWIQKATLDCLVRVVGNVIDRSAYSKNLVNLVVLVADELERQGVFDKE